MISVLHLANRYQKFFIGPQILLLFKRRYVVQIPESKSSPKTYRYLKNNSMQQTKQSLFKGLFFDENAI
jgi:hypothetical protein